MNIVLEKHTNKLENEKQQLFQIMYGETTTTILLREKKKIETTQNYNGKRA